MNWTICDGSTWRPQAAAASYKRPATTLLTPPFTCPKSKMSSYSYSFAFVPGHYALPYILSTQQNLSHWQCTLWVTGAKQSESMALYILNYWQCTVWAIDTVQSESLTLYTLNHWQCTVWVTDNSLSLRHCKVWVTGTTHFESMILYGPSTDTVQSATDNEQSEPLTLNGLSHWHCTVGVTDTESLTVYSLSRSPVLSASLALYSLSQWS